MKSWASDYKFKPITEAQKKYHKNHSAKFIFVDDKNGNAHCSRCDENFVLSNTKHKEYKECPSCGARLQIQHKWRMKKRLEVIDWMVIPKALDEHTLVLRFVLAYANGDAPLRITEKARFFINEFKAEPEYWTYEYNWHKKTTEWTKGKGAYFRVPSYMTPNRFHCYNAYEYPRNFFKEINKLDCFKYYPAEDHYDFHSYATQLHYMVRSARVNEKMEKAGLKKLSAEHRGYYINYGDRCYPINNKKTSLIDMLKLNKKTFSLLKESQSYAELKFLQKNPDINAENYKLVGCDSVQYKYFKNVSNEIGVAFTKLYKYVSNMNRWEYDHYLSILRYLHYDLTDTYYSMPKNFKKADERITAEYNAEMDRLQKIAEEERRKKESEKDGMIKKISDALHNMPNLAEYFNGSNGLLVYVPESQKELREEGNSLHNCISTYANRIAEGKTIIFYIRQLSNPTAPFVAMEYCNGSIIQCRYDHNESVYDKDDEQSKNIINFAEALASTLKENKVLAG